MNPDHYQQAWRAHSAQTTVKVNAEVLREEVQRSQQQFRTIILARDFREVGIALIMIPVWLVLGVTTSQPWSWYVTVPALLWVIGFMVVDRKRHPQKRIESGVSLLDSVAESLHQVEHQIWLLRNVFWWYLLPFTLALSCYFVHIAWRVSGGNLLVAFLSAAPCFAFVGVLYGFIYYLNQLAVRKQLEPQRQELLALLASLRDETGGAAEEEYPQLTNAGLPRCSTRRLVLANIVGALLLLAGVSALLLLMPDSRKEYARKSPFTAVRWQEVHPEVEVGGEWFKLVSLDAVPAHEIVAFSQKTYGDRWRKRFEEDLVELLTLMGHAPRDKVTLVVQSLTSGETRTLYDVPMTTANRQAIWEAAQARGPSAPQATAPLAQALEGLRAEYKLPAMAAFVLRDDKIIERATVGTCTINGQTPVKEDAQWHLGSNTKAMTATLAGRLVEEGLLNWNSTVGEILGKAAPGMDPAHRETTLSMLLHHTSGIAPNIDWFSAPEDRVACVAQILSVPPEGKPGAYAYSNAGYVVAGAMMEVVTGKRWEDLMREKLFTPLGMKDTGFGPPTKAGSPWGHRSGWLRWTPMDPDTRGADNPPVMGPAGTVHTTMEDYARFIAAHLKGAQGKGGIVSAETFATLHAPLPGGDYGMGWIVTERGWAGGRALTHGGSNTLWFAVVWLAPEKDMAFFAATNAGGDTAGKAVDKAIELLISRQPVP